MKPYHTLPTAIAMVALSKETLAFGLGQVSIIAFQLAGTDIPHDTEQNFGDFGELIKGFYAGALTTDVVALSETIADSVSKANDTLEAYGNKMDVLQATRFKQLFTDLREHVAHHDTGGDFMGKLVKTTKTLSMLDEQLRAGDDAGDADKHLDALRPQAGKAPGADVEQQEAA